MKTASFLRIASVLTFLDAPLHTVGGVFGKQAPRAEQKVASAMKENAFPVMGGPVRTCGSYLLRWGWLAAYFQHGNPLFSCS